METITLDALLNHELEPSMTIAAMQQYFQLNLTFAELRLAYESQGVRDLRIEFRLADGTFPPETMTLFQFSNLDPSGNVVLTGKQKEGELAVKLPDLELY